MNVKTIHMSDIYNQCEDMYTAVMIIAKRAKQIIDERVVPIDESDDVEDSIEFEVPVVTTYTDKPETIALEEFINGELQWDVDTDNIQLVDES